MNRVRKRNSSPFGVFFAVALVAVSFISFPSTASPPGQVTNEQLILPSSNTGQPFVIDNAKTAPDITGVTANVDFNTATVNATVEPNNTVYGLANPGTVNDSSPPTGLLAIAQNIVVATPAETFREAHSDAILHGIAGQILLTATSLVRGVEYNLLC